MGVSLMKTDVQIAQEATLLPIIEIAEKLGINEDDLELYGKYKAKVSLDVLTRLKDKPDGKLVLVTAITPTPAGEGKTTTNVGLSMALNKIGKTAFTTLREPSLGPSFGVKGGAAGGGYAQVVPMEDINLHFTGDIHAVSTAHNLLAALLDNHLHQGNELNIDVRRIVWRRCLDMNERALRNTIIGLGRRADGYPRQDGFDITVASEVMAILCLSTSFEDLKQRISRMIIAYNVENKPVTVNDLGVTGALSLILKDAIKPNLVQTLENTPAMVHGGPFANIAHGCNSIQATALGLKLADYMITEAGFGADLGAEKFFDIKCRFAGLKPDCVVIVANARALKHHGGASKAEWGIENMDYLAKGFENLQKQIQNVQMFGVPAVVALNRFPDDTEAELEFIEKYCLELGADIALSEVWGKGGDGGIDLANKVVEVIEKKPADFKFLYDVEDSIVDKITTIATKLYNADGVDFAKAALAEIKKFEDLGLDKVPVCIAKTQLSLSDDPKKLGLPKNYNVSISNVKLSAGAGFVVAYAGEVMTMPGLPKVPAANSMDILPSGEIIGLF